MKDETLERDVRRLFLFWSGALVQLIGFSLLSVWVGRVSVWPRIIPLEQEALVVFPWAPVVYVGRAIFNLVAHFKADGVPPPLPSPALFFASAVLVLVGLVGMGLSARKPAVDSEGPSEARGAPLYPGLANYRDFYWATLAAYSAGIFLAEAAFVLVHTALAPRTSVVLGFVVSFVAAIGIVFVAGFLGAARARRVSVPEATIGLLYAGVPIPLFLTLVSAIPVLNLKFGYALREISHLAGLLGQRPEPSYWLLFAALILVMVLGITSGFVATASGKLDLRLGFETFVARRHVSIFRPGLIFGTLAVLILGIVPPLLIWAVISAAQNAIERTRIKRLGQQDPLAATRALHAAKLRELTPTAMMTALSVGGVGVGVMALIVVLSVMSGFELDLQKKILGTNAHAVVLKYTDDFSEWKDVMPKVKDVPGVTGTTPFILQEVMISSEGNIAGTLIKGIDVRTVSDVTDLRENIVSGELEWLVTPEKISSKRISPEGGPAKDEKPADSGRLGEEGAPPPVKKETAEEEPERDPMINVSDEDDSKLVLPGLVLGRELASSLKVVTGDRVNVVSPLGGELGPQGPQPKSRAFRVAGIFYSGMYEYDSKFVYIRLDEAQSFFGMKGVSGIELKLADIDDARRISKQVVNALDGYPYRARDWGEMNKNLFSALRLEKLVMGIILSIIVIVAGGLIIATMIMLVLEKRKEISVLKALGVPDGGIVKIFLGEGLQIGVAGGLLGLVSGLAWCFFIEKVGIKLDPEVYYIPALPVKVEPFQTLLPVVIAVLVTYLASIYPALKASRVEPVEGLKAE